MLHPEGDIPFVFTDVAPYLGLYKLYACTDVGYQPVFMVCFGALGRPIRLKHLSLHLLANSDSSKADHERRTHINKPPRGGNHTKAPCHTFAESGRGHSLVYWPDNSNNMIQQSTNLYRTACERKPTETGASYEQHRRIRTHRAFVALMTRHSLGVGRPGESSVDVEVRAEDKVTEGSTKHDCKDKVGLHMVTLS